jgi:hypothetical protein
VTGQRRRIQELLVCPLETLHEKIIPDLRTPSRQKRRPRPAFFSALLVPLHAQTEAIRGELDDLARLVGEGSITARQMALSSGPLQERLAKVEERIAAAAQPSLLAPFAGEPDVAKVWDGLPLDRRRAIVRRLMTIEVLRARRGRVPGWQPGLPYFDSASVRITPADQL